MALKRVHKLAKARPVLKSAVRPLVTGEVKDWHGEYAYSLGLQAFIYGFPYIYNARLRHKWTAEPGDSAFAPHAAVNEFWHASRLIDASYRDGGCPSNDTLYSIAWVDVGAEPVILSHPDMGERYFTFELAGVDSDNFGYVGQRATGSKAGSFAIVGPDWEGDLPAGVDASIAAAPSPWILILGRTAVDDEADVASVRKLQEQYRLTPLSRWGREDGDRPGHRDVLDPIEPEQDPLGPFKTLNAMLEENPPPAHHGLVLDQFARIGIGAGLDVGAQPEAVKQGLIRAEVLGMALLKQHFLSGDWATVVNGWRYPPPGIGRLGDDFLQRAADQSLAGIACNDPAEAVYLVTFTDGQEHRLTGGSRYVLRFRAGSMPPAGAFWSLTMYGTDLNLVANPIGRYSVRGAAPGLKKEPDGGLTIYLQAGPPGKDKEANWLPCPADGEWLAILRMYLPRPEVIKAEWECPPIERMD